MDMFIIGIVALLIIGFFFPPVWLILLGLGIYLWISRKTRRSRAIERRVKEMMATGKNYMVFSELYFEAARGYAVEKGAKASDHNSASAHIIIDDRDYLVIFTRSTTGGTIISIRDGNMVKDYLDDIINKTKLK